jgi:hypothetical protein
MSGPVLFVAPEAGTDPDPIHPAHRFVCPPPPVASSTRHVTVARHAKVFVPNGGAGVPYSDDTSTV